MKQHKLKEIDPLPDRLSFMEEQAVPKPVINPMLFRIMSFMIFIMITILCLLLFLWIRRSSLENMLPLKTGHSGTTEVFQASKL
jgi:hypothetical protein